MKSIKQHIFEKLKITNKQDYSNITGKEFHDLLESKRHYGNNTLKCSDITFDKIMNIREPDLYFSQFFVDKGRDNIYTTCIQLKTNVEYDIYIRGNDELLSLTIDPEYINLIVDYLNNE